MGACLNQMLTEAGQAELSADLAARFGTYCGLLMRWNARTNLTAVRDEDGILRRHFVESIVCARALPDEIGTLLDFGSGAGFPGLPIALCRPALEITLAESQGKKAAFLREAVRVLGLSVKVHGGRAEMLGSEFDCVTLRAVDRMSQAVAGAAGLVRPSGWLAAITTAPAAGEVKAAAGDRFLWSEPVAQERGTERILLLGQKQA